MAHAIVAPETLEALDALAHVLRARAGAYDQAGVTLGPVQALLDSATLAKLLRRAAKMAPLLAGLADQVAGLRTELVDVNATYAAAVEAALVLPDDAELPSFGNTFAPTARTALALSRRVEKASDTDTLAADLEEFDAGLESRLIERVLHILDTAPGIDGYDGTLAEVAEALADPDARLERDVGVADVESAG